MIIPTYNEKDNIEALLKAIGESVSVDVLIVDDGSPDGTGQLADSLAEKYPFLHVMHRAGKLGLGTAYVAGFEYALAREYDACIEMDADFSHHPRYLPQMLALLEHYDVVVGSRYVTGGGTLNWSLGRKLLSRLGGIYARLILGAPIADFTGGFNGWRRHVLEKVRFQTLRSDGYSFQIELKYRAFKAQCSIKEFPILFEDRKVGHSKMSRRIVFEALVRVWGFRYSRFS